ncbi:MAG TPA: N-acetylneuraminate synthase family protein [bacterium]|nr:N-acetylneuraminate synthase family protein [bacterium]
MTYIIAEIGNNHNVDLNTASKMINIAADCKANAVKFQTFKAEDIVSPFVKADEYNGWDVSDKYEYWIDYLRTWELPLEWYDELIELTHSLGLDFISTPTSIETAEFLYSKKIDAIKIASMDVTNIPLIERISQMDIPVIMSVGMADEDEIDEAVSLFDKSKLSLLHCVSDYPLDINNAQLNTIKFLEKKYRVPVGFSDHSLDVELDVYAVCAGAKIIEKHFTLDRKNHVKAEHHFSLEPEEFKSMVSRIRSVEKILGEEKKVISENEKINRDKFRRSIFFKRNMSAGEIITEKDILWIRPATSVKPKYKKNIIGKKLKKNINAYTAFNLEDLT